MTIVSIFGKSLMLNRYSICNIIKIIVAVIVIGVYSIKSNYSVNTDIKIENKNASNTMDWVESYPKLDNRGCEILFPPWVNNSQVVNLDMNLSSKQDRNWCDTGVIIRDNSAQQINIRVLDVKNTVSVENQRKYLLLFEASKAFPDGCQTFITQTSLSSHIQSASDAASQQNTTINVNVNDIINISLISHISKVYLDNKAKLGAPDSLINHNALINNLVFLAEDQEDDIKEVTNDLSKWEKCNIQRNQGMIQKCIMDMGLGMVITLDSKTLKEYSDQFIKSSDISDPAKNALGIYHIVAKSPGTLKFTIPSSFKQLLGTYLMEVTIVSPDNFDNVYNNDLEYIVSDVSPNKTTIGTTINADSVDIPTNEQGKLWIRQASKSSNNTTKTISLKITTPNDKLIKYKIASTIGDNIYNPIHEKLREVSKLFFTNLASNNELKKVVYILVTLYIMLSTMQFLTGMSQLTSYEVLVKLTKIIAVTGIFTNYSTIVHEYLFGLFSGGMEVLISNVVNNGNRDSINNVNLFSNNPFYFLDVIINRYLDLDFFKLLLIELVHLRNGLFIIPIVTVLALYRFFCILFSAVIEIMTSMITISILISFGPLFIICLLFKRTSQIFRRWILATFANVLIAFLLIIFISIIDALMVSTLQAAIPYVKICWGEFLNLGLHLDLSAVGISKIIDIPLTTLNFYNVVWDDTTSLFDQGIESTSLGKMLAGTLLLYYMSMLSSTLVKESNIMKKKNLTKSKKSYVKQLVQEMLD